MTESEWLAGEDVEGIAEVVWRMVSDRKTRLIACGCCRRAWEWLVDERSRNVVEVSERFADGHATEDELRTAAWYAEAAVFSIDEKAERYRREQKGIRDGWMAVEDCTEDALVAGQERTPIPFNTARAAATCAEATANNPSFVLQERPNAIFSLAVLRDVAGNPFRPVVLDPVWLTARVRALAASIYDERAFDRMLILADALQDAGCENPAILDHCRGPGPHVRGCWLVDQLLAKG